MKGEFTIPLFFWIVGLLWISLSDQWVFLNLPEESNRLFFSKMKGFGFITFSSLLLFILIRYDNRRLVKEQHQLYLQTEENRRLFDVLNKVKNFIIFSDNEARITWVNQAFSEHTGYSLDEIRGKYAGEILRGPETSSEAGRRIDGAIKNKMHCNAEVLNYKKNGERYWTNLYVTPLFNDRGETSGFISIQSDITSHRRLENQLIQHIELLRKITWMTSHDIRRPLSSILSLIDLIKTGTEEEREECLRLLYQSADDLDQVIRTVNEKINLLETPSRDQTTL